MNDDDNLIKKLSLIPHPEGGHFAETFKDRKNYVSHIYYLLKKNERSHWHKLSKNEILHFYDGSPMLLLLSKDKIKTSKIILGRKIEDGQNFYYLVKAETWFSMRSLGKWSLIGCTVAPAFNFSDFELAPKNWKPGNNL